MGLITLNDDQLNRVRVSDGLNLTVQDAILILRYIVGLIESFPVEKECNLDFRQSLGGGS